MIKINFKKSNIVRQLQIFIMILKREKYLNFFDFFHKNKNNISIIIIFVIINFL